MAVVILFLLPWLDKGAVKSVRYRGTLFKTWLALFVVSFLVLGLGLLTLRGFGSRSNY